MTIYTMNSDGTFAPNPTELTADDFEYHYVTITGTIEIDGVKYLKIQTWGRTKYLKYDDIFDALNAEIYYSY